MEEESSSPTSATVKTDLVISSQQNRTAANVSIIPPNYSAYGPDWVLSSDAKTRLKGHAKYLKERLNDQELRQRITNVLSSSDTPIRKHSTATAREVALGQLDVRLLEDLRVIGGILERNDESVPLEEWLRQRERTSNGLRLVSSSNPLRVASTPIQSLPNVDDSSSHDEREDISDELQSSSEQDDSSSGDSDDSSAS